MISLVNYSIQEFSKLLDSGVEAVSIGAGQALLNLCRKYEKLAGCLSYAADNYKTGAINLNGYTIPIRRLEQCEKREGTIFLISTFQYAIELIEQLDQTACFDGVEVCVPALFQEEVGAETELAVFQKGARQLIPKTIHYCWFGGKEFPEKFQKNIETWRHCCPDYEIVCWNEDNYDVGKNLYMKQAYDRRYWGFVPDYARLDIVNTYGGVYLDTDVELLRPLDDLLQFKLYCGFESKEYVNFGLGFGSQKNSAVLCEMMVMYDKMMFVRSDGSLNLTPSPKYQTEVLKRHGLRGNGHTQITEDFIALTPEYLNPIDYCGGGELTVRSFSIHQFAASWFTDEQKARREKRDRIYQYLYRRMG